MVPERDVDCGAIYEDTRQQLLSLVRSLTPEELAITVPATPEWTVRDVLSHVVGINTDLNNLVFGTAEPDAWTAAHVNTRRDRDLDEVVAEWDAEAPNFEQGLRELGYEVGSHFVGDLLQHCCDVTHALARPHPADGPRLAVGLDFYLTSFEQSLERAGIGSVDVTAGDEHWTVGSGTTVAAVSGPRFEMFRALGGRRSADQIRRLEWNGDVEKVMPVISRYPLPERPIVEPG